MPAMDFVVGMLPIVGLVIMTVKGVPSRKSLPIAAVALWFIALAFFKLDANRINATVLKGVGDSLTPIAIVFGAICFFESMKLTPVLEWMRYELKALSRGNAAAEIALIAWAFSYVIEGCSGFGTPTAIAAPLLVEIGYDPLSSIICCLIMNTLATPFGAAGTPIWFGLDGLGLPDETLDSVGQWVQGICFTAAHIVPFVAVNAVRPLGTLTWGQIGLIYASIYACSGMSLVVSFFSYELPTLLGGFIGLAISGALVKWSQPREGALPPVGGGSSLGPAREGRNNDDDDDVAFDEEADVTTLFDDGGLVGAKEDRILAASSSRRSSGGGRPASVGSPISGVVAKYERTEPGDFPDFVASEDTPTTMTTTPKGGGGGFFPERGTAATMSVSKSLRKRLGHPFWMYLAPITLVVVFLTITRAPYLDLKDELKSRSPSARFRMGSFGEVFITGALVVGIDDIFRSGVTTVYEILYTPALLPFVAVALITLALFGQLRADTGRLFANTWKRTESVVVPVVAALVFADLMRAGVAARIATPLVPFLGKVGWSFCAPLWGCLGTFFSGSTTVSNLTFGSIHILAADRLGLDKAKLLALQTAGATIGNAISLQNIIAAKTVVGLDVLEFTVIAKTARGAALFVLVAWIWGLIFLFAGV